MKRLLAYLWVSLPLLSLHAQSTGVSMVFAGDAMQHQSQIDAAKRQDGYDYSSCFSLLGDRIKSRDIAVVNLESPMGGKPYTGYPSFSTPDEYVWELDHAGFNVYLLGNNHILDKSKKGLERTIEELDKRNLIHTGAFRNERERENFYPLFLSKNGIVIAIINCTYATNGIIPTEPNVVNYIDSLEIKNDIDRAKEFGADIIVANMHWGEEYMLDYNNTQKKLADMLVRNGVRIVMGNHPHVVQPMEIRQNDEGEIDAVIVYSLGNFISNMKIVNGTGGMLVYLDLLREDGKIKITSCDYSLVWTWKKTEDKRVKDYILLPVEDYHNEVGQAMLTDAEFSLLDSFAKTAKKTIEKNWAKEN